MASRRIWTKAGGRPRWITEGVANRWSAQYHESIGGRAHADHIRDAFRAVRPHITREREADGLVSVPNNSRLWDAAATWAASLAGQEDAWFSYFAQRPSFPTWEEAFRAVFGISVADFYLSFDRHLADVAPSLPVIRGTLLDAAGGPVAGAQVRAIPQGGQPEARADTGEDGTFAIPVHEGPFLLEIHADSPGGWQDIGWYGVNSGFTPVRSQAQVVDVTGEGITGVTIQIPEIDWRRIEGVLLGPGGEPVEGVIVDAYPRGEYAGPWDQSDEEGRFSMFVAGGRFDLHLYADAPDGRQRLGSYGSDDGFSPLFEVVETIHVQDRDVTGIAINLPVPSVSPVVPARRRCGGAGGRARGRSGRGRLPDRGASGSVRRHG